MDRNLKLEVGRAIADPQIGTYIYTFMIGYIEELHLFIHIYIVGCRSLTLLILWLAVLEITTFININFFYVKTFLKNSSLILSNINPIYVFF